MATVLKLKSDIKKLKAAIARKGTPSNLVPKLKSQLEKVENELASMQKGASPRKVSTTKSTSTALSKLQKMVQTKKYSSYQGAGVDLKKDADDSALPKGVRVSKGLKANQYGTAKQNKGKKYYEYRPNRFDVKQPKGKQTYPKLEDGGMMEKGGKLDVGVYRVGRPTKVSPNLYEQKIVEIFENGDIATASDYGRSLKDFKSQKYPIISKERLEEEYKMEDGGMMAKGGEIKPYIIWVSKDGEKREFYGKYISMRSAESAMKKLWDSGEYQSMGFKPKSMYEKEGLYAKGGMMADGGMMAKGGESQGYDDREDERLSMEYGKMAKKDLKSTHSRRDDARFEEREPKVVRGYSDDEAYEYAKGGLTQHGLKQGDMIMGHSDNNVVVKDKSNKIYIININNGTRLSEEEFEKFSSREKTKFSKMAHGGHVMSKTHRISK